MINKMNMTVAAAAVMLGSVSAFAQTTVKVYGFAKAGYIYEDKGFNQDAKPINVNNQNPATPLTADQETFNNATRGQFTARHSRFGVDVDNGSAFKGKMEFDLDGQADANGGNTVGVLGGAFGAFRVRQANITYKVNETDTVTLGKKWEIFSPLQPHSYQVTTIQFWAGNTGFITDGIDYTHKGETFGWAAELKNATTNVMTPTTDVSGNTMKVSAPVVTLRGDWKFMEGQMVGVSAFAGKLAYDKLAAANQAQDTNAYNLYYNGKWGAFDLVAEVYQGKNAGAGVTGGLALSTPVEPAGYKGEEMGYYVSGKYMLTETQGIFAGYGEAKLTEDVDVAGSFRSLASNSFARLGYDHVIDNGVTFYVEGAMLNSGYLVNGSVEKSAGTFVDVGLIARF